MFYVLTAVAALSVLAMAWASQNAQGRLRLTHLGGLVLRLRHRHGGHR
jgi:hypothetical protein